MNFGNGTTTNEKASLKLFEAATQMLINLQKSSIYLKQENDPIIGKLLHFKFYSLDDRIKYLSLL